MENCLQITEKTEEHLMFGFVCNKKLNFPKVFWTLNCTADYRRRCDITPKHVGTSASKYYSQAEVGKLSKKLISGTKRFRPFIGNAEPISHCLKNSF